MFIFEQDTIELLVGYGYHVGFLDVRCDRHGFSADGSGGFQGGRKQ